MFLWKGIQLKSMGDIMAIAVLIQGRSEARRFLWAYVESCPALSEVQCLANLRYGFSRHFDTAISAGDAVRRMALFS